MNIAMLRNMSNDELDRMIPFIITSPSLTEQDIINEIQRRVEELDEEIEEETTSRIADITEELNDERELEIEDLREEHKNKINKLNNQLEDYSYASKNQKVQIMSLTRKLESLTEEQDYVPNEILGLKDEISQLKRNCKKEKKEYKEETASLKEQLVETEDANSRLRSEHQALGEQLKRLERTCVNISNDRDSYRRDWQNSANELDVAKRDLKTTSDKLAAREKQVEVLIEQNTKLSVLKITQPTEHKVHQPPDITRENLDRFIHSMRTAISVLEKDVYSR